MPKPREPKRGGVPFSALLVRRKREELQTLRLEADTLTDQLSHLQAARLHHSAALASPSTSSGDRWRSAAAAEGEKRQHAEKTNRKLKVKLAELMKIRAPVLSALDRYQALKDLDFVLQLQPKVYRPPREARLSDAVLEELTNNLDCLRLDTDTVFPVMESSMKVSFRSQSLPESNCIQASSITPVAGSSREIGEMLWLHASKKKRETDKLFHYVHRKSPSPLDVNVEASFVEGSLCVNSVSTFRRYDEGDRILLVGMIKWFVGKLVLRDYNWTVISASPEDSAFSAGPDRGAIAPPVDESEKELDDEPELLWAEVESEPLCPEVESVLESLAADSESDEVLDVAVDAEVLVLFDEVAEVAALVLDEVKVEEEDEEEEIVAVVVDVIFSRVSAGRSWIDKVIKGKKMKKHAAITDATLLRGSAFVSAKPFAIATNKAIYWEPTSSFDRRFFSFDYLQPQVTKAGMAQVSISLEHADCQSDVAFRLRLEETEVAVVADDACLESNRSSVASYVHTIPVKANETLSFEYIGGGTLNTEKSFVDVLLLPPNPEY
ncbi:hypothetical protein PHYSODRAFT_339908 [Phytophthora sojae]|uniref:Uncharacterized protein n=1 Tax=Phytophthora sojae (strain P6497) TaxID=1094619 RepID=G5A807_PHYSP|nr:hypothetical protein PHYSODRAFT_339908 [Phytophthora sojae]EGZ08033.1 hypothetical protein PHYSODRAFT_339908 [Phytophthora sojae]|eukprot:XP_009536205.1 hypothetical protein PHYSODRAFT_339908 [Phytophthora sojae]